MTSLSTPEIHQQGMNSQTFIIPTVLEKAISEPVRTLESLAERPKYMCINHIFEFEGQRISSVMTMRGDAIDRVFKLSRMDTTLTFAYMPAYTELLHEAARGARAQLAGH
jgi:hypothetical protein